ncbi:hypothetical protein HDU76_011937 [Blyttiomyces sp. JEL0837]|nr:hypothetical protein HDU76_011937 [Blyttiomyces sp. JEL0837]
MAFTVSTASKTALFSTSIIPSATSPSTRIIASSTCTRKINVTRSNSSIAAAVPYKREVKEPKIAETGVRRRVFRPSETYRPQDLNLENLKWYEKELQKTPKIDVFKVLNLSPVKEYKMGGIKPKTETGLESSTQRKLAKAIKRSRAMGLMPYTCKLSSSKNQQK